MLEFQQFYRRNLPHIQPPGATLFVTSMLDGAIPVQARLKLDAEAQHMASLLNKIDDPKLKAEQAYLDMKRLFGRWDKALDTIHDTSPRWLQQNEIAEIVRNSLDHLDGKFCRMLAYTIMPTHVHAVFTPLEKENREYHSIAKIVHSWKRISAIKANDKLNRTGKFWYHENYDHYARSPEEVERIVSYIKNNPVKAGLAQNWDDWQWTFIAG